MSFYKDKLTAKSARANPDTEIESGGITNLLSGTIGSDRQSVETAIDLGDGTSQPLSFHLHPQEDQRTGQIFHFDIRPRFVAVLDNV